MDVLLIVLIVFMGLIVTNLIVYALLVNFSFIDNETRDSIESNEDLIAMGILVTILFMAEIYKNIRGLFNGIE